MDKCLKQTSIKKNTLRFNTTSNVDSQVAYAEKYLLNHENSEESYILLQGTGVTTSKVVAAVERIKENFRELYGKDLYQINKIGSIVFDKENRCVKEEDLPEADSSVTDKAVYAGLRRVSCIEIILSIDKIETEEDTGFQYDVKIKHYKPKSSRYYNSYRKKYYQRGNYYSKKQYY